MVDRIKNFAFGTRRRKTVFFMTALFIVALLVCIIVNLVMAGTLSWSLLVLGALVYAWVPLFLLICKKKSKLYWVIGSMCVLALPLMLWIYRQGVAQHLIRQLGMPVAACCIGYVLFLLVLCKFLKRVQWSYKVALAVALLIPLSIAINILYSTYSGKPFPLMEIVASSLILLCAALVFFVPSFINKSRRQLRATHTVQQAHPAPLAPKAVEPPKDAFRADI